MRSSFTYISPSDEKERSAGTWWRTASMNCSIEKPFLTVTVWRWPFLPSDALGSHQLYVISISSALIASCPRSHSAASTAFLRSSASSRSLSGRNSVSTFGFLPSFGRFGSLDSSPSSSSSSSPKDSVLALAFFFFFFFAPPAAAAASSTCRRSSLSSASRRRVNSSFDTRPTVSDASRSDAGGARALEKPDDICGVGASRGPSCKFPTIASAPWPT